MTDYLRIVEGLSDVSDGEKFEISNLCTSLRPVIENIARRMSQSKSVTFSKELDQLSPSLIKACLMGDHFEGIFHVSAPTGAWTLSFSQGYIITMDHDSSGPDGKMMEHVTIDAGQWSFNNSVGATREQRTLRKR